MSFLFRLFTLHARQTIPLSLESCWEFFSDPRNLKTITPPELNLAPLSAIPDAMYPGMILTYRVRPAFGVPILWVTEITHVERLHRFIDEQRFGPYRFWHHEHRFAQGSAGSVCAEDIIHYAIPAGPFAGWANRMFIQPQLRRIFEFRSEALVRLFGGSQECELEFAG